MASLKHSRRTTRSSAIAVKRALQFTLLLCPMPLAAQRLTVVIDPARGGTEYGARIDQRTYEKQVTLDLANRLKSLLAARDFDVVLTRETDALVSNDQRAALANQSKPVACLLLHSTSSGNGLHLFTSSLPPATASNSGVLWDEAQAPYVQRSERLQTDLATAFTRSKIQVSSGHTWIRPLDNMQCPALAIEVAPDGSTNAADRSYQGRIADAIASSLLQWRSRADIMQSIVAPVHEVPATTQPVAPKIPAAGETVSTSTITAKPAAETSATSADQSKPPVRKIPQPVKPVPIPSEPESGKPQ